MARAEVWTSVILFWIWLAILCSWPASNKDIQRIVAALERIADAVELKEIADGLQRSTEARQTQPERPAGE